MKRKSTRTAAAAVAAAATAAVAAPSTAKRARRDLSAAAPATPTATAAAPAAATAAPTAVYVHSEALRHLRSADTRLGALIDAHPPPHDFRKQPNVGGAEHLFKSLCQTIIFQQLAGKAAQTIFNRFVRLFFPDLPDGDTSKFPTAHEVAAKPLEELRTAGLSERKASYILDLASKVISGELRLGELATLPDDEISRQLIAVRGIGPWSVHMFLMFQMDRKDVLPDGDLGVRKGLMQHAGLKSLPSPQQMHALTDPWRPYRTIGSWLMWQSLDSKST